MISFLEGDVAERSGARVVISVGGVGYDVQVPASTLAKLPPVGRPTRVYTRLVVRDDAMTLFGFANADERELFDLLVTVSGIGPKVALRVPVACSRPTRSAARSPPATSPRSPSFPASGRRWRSASSWT